MQQDEMGCVEQDEVSDHGPESATQGCMEHDEMRCMEQDEMSRLGPDMEHSETGLSMQQENVTWKGIRASRSCR